MLKHAEFRNRVSTYTTLFVLFVIATVFTGLGVALWRIHTIVFNMKAEMSPAVELVVNKTLGAIVDSASTLANVRSVSYNAHVLTSQSRS